MSAGDDPVERLRRLPRGTKVELRDTAGRGWSGTVIPPSELTGDGILTLKLASGYNVGVRVDPAAASKVGSPPEPGPPTVDPPKPVGDRSTGAWVALLTTGGTIASRVDYETGGVRPVHTESEILEFFPDLATAGDVRVVRVFDRMSEDLVPADWLELATKTVEAFRAGATGVVIAHGTDTLGYSAAALSFLLEGLPGPVVLVGAQRSADRPSSDGASNLAAAVTVARDRRIGEVVVVMHAGLSDDRFAIHRGSRVRKMHSSRRDAFESRNGPPLGTVVGNVVTLDPKVRAPSPGPARVDGPLDPRGALVWSYPGLTPEGLDAATRGTRGVVLAGTGLGHVGGHLLSWIRAAKERGLVVAMTTQCLEGGTDPYVYATGRELLRAGVLYLGDLLPETAYAKLLWALGHETTPDGVRARLLRDRAGEYVACHRAEGPA